MMLYPLGQQGELGTWRRLPACGASLTTTADMSLYPPTTQLGVWIALTSFFPG
ncbi:MAG: hypothetical protein QHJ34_02675 [bacterium]|nr:hypothetical protein [candidate division KSB1 bacterium]MDH7559123.1 hypothetical protein [bacterium]